jgi:general secretion pathway protein K
MKGVALVVVLFILSIMTIMISWLTEDSFISIKRTYNIRDSQQAYQLAVGSESWGMSVLKQDGMETETDHYNEIWNKTNKVVSVKGGVIQTVISDQSALFNLNNLYNANSDETVDESIQPKKSYWVILFRRLLQSLEIDEGLTDAVLDWIDKDENVRGSYGAEDGDYLSESPSYRSANRMFSDISELLLVKGFDENIVKKLSPYITALPETDVKININTVPELLMRNFTEELMTDDQVEELIELQGGETGINVQEFLQQDAFAGENQTISDLIDNKSVYFIIQSKVQYENSRINLISLVKREGSDVAVIQRSPVL